jgi:hypothetical protein
MLRVCDFKFGNCGFDRGLFVRCVDDADEGRRTSFDAGDFPPVLLSLAKALALFRFIRTPPRFFRSASGHHHRPEAG